MLHFPSRTLSNATACIHFPIALILVQSMLRKWVFLKRMQPLLPQLFLSVQSRPEADMSDFFKFENQREPPSLADRGRLRSGTKSDILKCLGVPTTASPEARNVSVQALDMPAVIHMVRPTRAATFIDYVPMHVVPFMKSQLTSSVERVDAVCDTYPDRSLKIQAQLRRGSGPRTRICQAAIHHPKERLAEISRQQNRALLLLQPETL